MPVFSMQEKLPQFESVAGLEAVADGAGMVLTVVLARQLINIVGYLLVYNRLHCRHKVTPNS